MKKVFLVDERSITIGRLSSSSIACKDILEMSSTHLKILKDKNQSLATVSGKNGIYVNGKFVRYSDNILLNYADEIEIFNLRIMWLEDLIAIEYAEEPKELYEDKVEKSRIDDREEDDNRIVVRLKEYDDRDKDLTKNPPCLIQYGDYFRKSPRSYYSLDTDSIELEAPPQRHIEEKSSVFLTIGPAFTMALPMLMGFTISRICAKTNASSAFLYTGLITAVVSAILGLIWGITNIKNRRNQFVINEKRRQESYTRYVGDSENKIKELYNKNSNKLRLKYPEINEYVREDVNTYMLWNKSFTDDDFLAFRIGTGNIPFDLNITIPKDKFSLIEDDLYNLPRQLKEKYSVLMDVPEIVDLRRDKCIGIVSDSKLILNETFLLLLISAAVSVSPNDIMICCFFEMDYIFKKSVQAIRFLPHLQDSSQKHRIVFTDNYEKARQKFNENSVTKDGERIENSFVVITDRFNLLPSECRFILQRDRNFSGYLHISKEKSTRRTVYFDKVTDIDANRISRILQGVKIKRKKEELVLKDYISYTELLGHEISKEEILKNWKQVDLSDEINAEIGILADGSILTLNLHEKGFGPHGLIAGTTGSGKSEILQTIILSLAKNYPKEYVGFFLIDYKGGGMSRLFEKLPHVLGSISNLSGRMIKRAMVSVKSENERRQKMFNHALVNNISEYQKLFRLGKVSEAIPHVFIIIDEFAELKKEEPEFMKELISVARVGRSLGVHLILATQKPSGVVDDNIKSNSRFRICLRVQDKMDSMEMIKRADAAFISNPGRAFLQVGNDEVFLEFQSAYTMDKGIYKGRNKQIEIYDIEERRMIGKCQDERIEGAKPQLLRALDCLNSAYILSDKSEVSPLWLEPLKEKIIFTNQNYIRDRYDISIGIYDDPAHQKQDILSINPVNQGSLIILGGLSCGKSTLLSTIAYQILFNIQKELVAMYFFDFSQGMLSPYKNSLATGGYISEENEEDIEKFFILINEIIEARKEILRGSNFRQYIAKYYKKESDGEGNSFEIHRLNPLLVFIDGIGRFRERTSGTYDKEFIKILKEGEALGVYLIVSAINISTSEIPKRIFDNFKSCIPLSLKDKYEYKDVLGAISLDIISPENLRGRGLVKIDENVVEFQSFLPVDADDDFDRMEVIADFVKETNRKLAQSYSIVGDKHEGEGKICNGLHNFIARIPTIPKPLSKITFLKEVELRLNAGEISETYMKEGIPIGFYTRSGRICQIPIRENLIVIISGRKGSGKSNLFNLIKKMTRPQALNKVKEELGVNEKSELKELQTYEVSEDSELEELKFSNGMKVYVYDERLSFERLAAIKKEAGTDPFVIHLGGAIDRQNLADFSYISYTEQMKVYPAGNAIIRKTSIQKEYGNILIPMI